MNTQPVWTPLESRSEVHPAWIRRVMDRFIARGRGSLKANPQALGRSRSINQDPLLETLLDDVIAGIPVEKIHEVAHDVAYLHMGFVNVTFIGNPSAGDRRWVLVDTGLPGLASRIEKAARQRFGKNSRPAAILVTHAHLDHVGGLKELAQKWNVTIYAHPFEMPYLDGRSAYPPLPVAGRSGTPSLLPLFESCSLGVGAWLQPLPSDGSLPYMHGWKWIHTPGHSPGHVSLWRAADHLLVAGDALMTTDPESAYIIGSQAQELHGPALVHELDQATAHETVAALALLLKPETIIAGHGKPMHGAGVLASLEALADQSLHVAEAPARSVRTKGAGRKKESSLSLES